MRDRRRRRRAAAVLAALALLLWRGNRVIVTDELAVPCAALPAEFADFRIAVLADLHGAQFGRDNARLLAALTAAQPDLIAVCGDLVDEPAQVEAAAALLGACTAIAPVCYVTGNHEWACGAARPLMAALGRAGVRVLGNDFFPLERGGAQLVLAGVHDPNGPYDMETPEQLVARIRDACGDAPIVLLAHRNDAPETWQARGVEVVLCGHAHGGVLRLPGVGGVFGPGRTLFPEHTAGLYRAGETSVAVSRGLGNVDGTVRVFNPPELLVVTLVEEKA